MILDTSALILRLHWQSKNQDQRQDQDQGQGQVKGRGQECPRHTGHRSYRKIDHELRTNGQVALGG